MGRPRQTPRIRKHTTGQVQVRFGTVDKYYGRWEEESSHRAAELAIAAYLAGGQIDPPGAAGTSLNQLLEVFHKWAEEWYVKEGSPTSEKWAFNTVVSALQDAYGHVAVKDFGPEHLLAVRASFRAQGWGRRHINEQINRVRRIFRKGVEWGYVPVTVLATLREVQGLPPGKNLAPERADRLPPSLAVVQKTMKSTTTVVAAMIWVQYLCAMRPAEVCQMRSGDLDRERYLPLWLYQPGRHKTQHRGRLKKIWIGGQAQKIIEPLLCERADEPIFKSRGGRQYRRDSYNRKIALACIRANAEHWSAGQLRSLRLTEIESQFDLDHAAASAGHSEVDVTRRHYAKADSLAKRVATKIG